MLIQLQVINKILATHDFSFITQNNIDSSYFPNFTSEFIFINKHYLLYGQVPDTVTFLKSFPEFEVIEVNEPVQYLVNELYRERNESFLATTFNKIKSLLLAGKTDDAMNLFSKSAQTALSKKNLEAVNILEDISRYDSYVEKCNDFNKYYITTGFRELDDSLGGGIDRQNAYFVISARAGIGKTLIMTKFAAAAASKGLKVGFYEGEMTVDKLAYRYDTLTSHISNGSIMHGNSSVANTYKMFLDNLTTSNKHFYILTRDMVPDEKVTVSVLESFVDKYDLDILFVDQISLLDSNLKGARSFEQVADISKELKSLQSRKNIPIVVASQQNRTAVEEGKLAGTENLALSDRVGQDASEVLFISKDENVMTFNIAKARDGAKKYVLKYLVDFDKGVFSYIPDSDTIVSETSEQPVRVNASGEAVF